MIFKINKIWKNIKWRNAIVWFWRWIKWLDESHIIEQVNIRREIENTFAITKIVNEYNVIACIDLKGNCNDVTMQDYQPAFNNFI